MNGEHRRIDEESIPFSESKSKCSYGVISQKNIRYRLIKH